MKIAIITSIFGTEQTLHDPVVKFDSADYIAFVDREHDSKVWKQIQSVSFSLDVEYKGRSFPTCFCLTMITGFG